MGKLWYFANLNSSAIKGDDFPIKTIIPRARENSEVVIKFTQNISYTSYMAYIIYIYMYIYIYTYIYIYICIIHSDRHTLRGAAQIV